MDRKSLKRLLICVDWFDPAIRAGGPITSCVNLAQVLATAADVSVLTGCRDLGANEDLRGVSCGTWNRWRGISDVWYATKNQHRLGAFYKACKSKKIETVYLNSMFSINGTILPLLGLPLLGGKRVVLAPRGMLKASAISVRNGRKKNWIRFLNRTGLTRKIHFHATSDEESEEIRLYFGPKVSITIIPNIPRTPTETLPKLDKLPGQLRLSFVGRVHPIKNLHLALDLLSSVEGDSHLDVIGPVESESYSTRCDQLIENLPPNIKVTRHGALSVEKSLELVKNSHVMFLPTQGENFGHAIFEAMGVGVPVLISDQTYWRGLENRRAGWDRPLERSNCFRDILARLAKMDQAEHQLWREGAQNLAMSFFHENNFKDAYLKLFFPGTLPHAVV